MANPRQPPFFASVMVLHVTTSHRLWRLGVMARGEKDYGWEATASLYKRVTTETRT